MRSLSSTLLAAQKSKSASPYVKIEIVDRVAGVARLNWSRLYTGSEADCYHALAVAGDGSLIRARVDASTYQLYYQRVTNPGPGSDFSGWTGVGTISSVSGIALASLGATVLIFYVATDQKTIYVKESTDNGASWGSPVSITTASTSVGWLAADFSPSGVVALLYSVGGTVSVVKRTGGTWGAPQAWTNTVASITGFGCVHEGDWNVVVSGKDAANNFKVWTCVYGDGYSQSSGTWSALAELTTANDGSNVEFHCPFVGSADVFRLFVVEKYAASQSYSRPIWSHSLPTADFIDNLWREPVPFDLSSSYGAAIAFSNTYAWLSTAFGVWQATLTPASVEVTADVVNLALSLEPVLSRARVELRNDDGRYQDIGSGSYSSIRKGSEILVSPGYRTTAGVEVSTGLAFWIEGWEYISHGGRATFVIYVKDGWGLLREWRARRQYSWTAGSKNVFQLLSFVLARVGLELSSYSTSLVITDQYPAFTIHPDESGATAVGRLLAIVPDVLFFRGRVGYIKYPQASDPSDYSYGLDHPLMEGRYRTHVQGFNRVQVYGSGVFNESFGWGEIEAVYDHLTQVHDLNLDSVSEAQARANAELTRSQRQAIQGQIVVPANCGQELWDVVAITDARAGLTAAQYRVLGLNLQYSPLAREARYDQKILLGGV
ncbi:MAG: hypothetical protein HY664_04055 [Chloroflexi bacterium]|nr:hypothetical protein [Chloroflexota bacterium]